MFEWKRKETERENKSRTEPNRTGIPSQLKKSLERNTGYSFDDVKVHYHSEKPARLEALAYTQGNQVYLGPGQERHLSHELGHVVQQKMGIVHADTRHESGAALNTDAALERQADEIGSGRAHLQGSPSAADTDTVQRMSVYEGVEGGKPKVTRYKRKGWIAAQYLSKYFTEDSLNEVTFEKMNAFAASLKANIDEGSVAAADEFRAKFLEAAGSAGLVYRMEDEALKAENMMSLIDEAIHGVTADETAGEETAEGTESAAAARRESNKKFVHAGKYEKWDDVDPYNNYKKMAMHCIAALTERNAVFNLGKTVGPHISVVILGKRILAANNSFYPKRGLEAVTAEELKEGIREALDKISVADIRDIMKNDGWYKNLNAPFEGSGLSLDDEKEKEIYDWIQKVKKYEIFVVGVPKESSSQAAQNPGGGAIHGEMAILDYLNTENNGLPFRVDGLPETTSRILLERQAKLADLRAQEEDETLKRVIWFGGTKIDCKKCHEHFQGLIEIIRENRIISSGQSGTFYYRKTEAGTVPKTEGTARIMTSEASNDFTVVMDDLTKLRDKLVSIQSGKDSGEAPELTVDEEALLAALPVFRPYFEPGRMTKESAELKDVRDLIAVILNSAANLKSE